MPKRKEVKKDKSVTTEAPMDQHLQEINEEIYRRNIELAVVNKTLSLLRKLYQVSLLTLDPASLSEKMSEEVRVDLNMETVGVFSFHEADDTLYPFIFSKSERLLTALKHTGFMFRDFIINSVSAKPVLTNVIRNKIPSLNSRLNDVWGGIINDSNLKTIAEESHIKNVLLYPLLSQNRTTGLLVLAINREYSGLSDFEKESVKNCVDVIAVALDKAILYEELQKANEQLEALDKARSEFITIASHQLRTPPATIKWFLSSILAGDYGKVDDGLKETLEKTARTNNSLIALIDDMLNVSRIERGKMEFLFQEVNLLDLAKITFEQLQPIAKEKGLKLAFNMPKSVPQIMADKEKIRQVMNNFIDNSIKYTKKGSITVDLSSTDEEIRFSVTDTGKGMSEDEKDEIFEKFKRGKESSKQSAGLGLGLYVAKVIVEQHKGKLWAESQGLDKGSSFIFTVPIHNGLTETTLVDLTKTQT